MRLLNVQLSHLEVYVILEHLRDEVLQLRVGEDLAPREGGEIAPLLRLERVDLAEKAIWHLVLSLVF